MNGKTEPPEEELPELFLLPVTREQLEYLGIGLAANASYVSREQKLKIVDGWHKSIKSWCFGARISGIDIADMSNDLTDKIAKLLGAERCAGCGHYHVGDHHG